ncbi:hypothetical protein C6558_35690 [Ensifer sp. NM-2]|nr:hypothetical protein C6558_35690 [Ensifer sp. NM-2]
MGELAANGVPDAEIEVIPPARDEVSAGNTTVCLCCQEVRSASRMDADGCGICDECLAPSFEVLFAREFRSETGVINRPLRT